MMRTKYSRLSHIERIEIYKLLALKKSLSEIARTLNRNKSTISREVKPFGIKNYHHYDGERKAVYSVSDRRSGKTKMKQNPTLEHFVLDKLSRKWSPDQISVSLRKSYPENKLMQI